MTIFRGMTASPDTCECHYTFEYDSDTGKHSYVNFLNRCPVHQGHEPHQVHAENTFKNETLKTVLVSMPEHCFFNGYAWDTEHGATVVDQEFFDKHGLQHSDFVRPVKVCHKAIHFSHDEERKLTFHIATLGEEHAAAVHAKVVEAHGDRVSVTHKPHPRSVQQEGQE